MLVLVGLVVEVVAALDVVVSPWLRSAATKSDTTVTVRFPGQSNVEFRVTLLTVTLSETTGLHALDPAVGATNLSTAHLVHSVAPMSPEKLPGGHGVHDTAEKLPAVVPGGHGTHALDPSWLNVPGLHKSHWDPPHPHETDPGGHALHTAAAGVLDAVPGGHALHSLDWLWLA